MIKSLETTGRTEDEAIAAALKELGLERDDVSVTVVERAKSGFLGIGASPAVVRVEYEAPDETETEAAPVVETKAPEKAAMTADNGEFAEIRAFLDGLLKRMDVKARYRDHPPRRQEHRRKPLRLQHGRGHRPQRRDP